MKTDLRREIFECRLRILSPLHIGCDAEYEPMGFCVDEPGQRLIVFDPHRFIAGLSPEDKAALSQICRKGTVASILELYQFLRGRQISGRGINVCHGFIDHYKQTLGIDIHDERKLKQELSHFSISRTAFTPHNQQPYIPGTALKGALRTGYLNDVASKKEEITVGKGYFAGVNLERKLLDAYSLKKDWKTQKERKVYGIEGDPFRLVKISDFRPLGEAPTKIVYAVNEKKTPSVKEAQRPFQLREVIEPGAEFCGQIIVETKHPRSLINHTITGANLLATTDWFFTSEQQREAKELRVLGSEPVVAPEDNKLALLRLGRHSGAECVTIEEYREINVAGPGKKPQCKKSATTLWLASDVRKPVNKQSLRPFGWAVLTDAEATRNKEREAEKKRAAALKRQAEWEAMSPEDRDIATVRDPSVNENQVVEIFNRMDQFSEPKKQELAQALKAYWIRHGKWDNKKSTAKQKQKVARVKAVLDEK